MGESYTYFDRFPQNRATLSVVTIDMIKSSFGISLIVLAASSAFAQSSSSATRARVVETESKALPSRVVVSEHIPPPPKSTPTPAKPLVTPGNVAQQPPVVVQQPVKTFPVTGSPAAPSEASNLNYKGLSFAQIKSKISEAKRAMQTRPIATAITEPDTSVVRIAYYDWRDKKIDYIVITKEAFLTRDVLTPAISTNGRQVNSRTIRANGVNTPIVITDEKGQPQLPLLVQYPVEKGGRYTETAYYMSTHPGLVTPEVVNAGRFYVHNVIEIARDQLRTKGYSIQPKVADIAEHLATVEHVDHTRFRTEFVPNIFNDIYTLYALNEGQTYRYSVSSAGAGGMVQMIPSTYRMVRGRYPNAALHPDFVEGMRNHVNATQAMLLYMQMTWNDLAASPTIAASLQSGIATQEQLMAAGYNSNPAKLAGYINRGGSSWTSLIPRETKIYLQIYSALQQAVTIPPRKL